MSTIPFSTFQGTLKFLRPESFTAETAAVVEFVCPGFIEDFFDQQARKDVQRSENYTAMTDQIFTLSKDLGFETTRVDIEPKRRRFAGDLTLSRGSYFGVCRDDTGRDDGAVANELMAYRVPEKTGYTWIWDLFDPKIAAGLGLDPRRSFAFRIDNAELFQNQYSHLFPTSSNNAALLFEIPYHVEHRTIDGTIDLRLPDTREWFFKTFQRGDGKYYEKPEGTNVSSFYEMLPALTRLDSGGGWETRGVGHWMRCMGVNALIFPSARCDVGVTIRESAMVDHYGWNLVDYRGTPKPPISNTVVDVSPWFTEVFRGVTIEISSRPPLVGSFIVRGVEKLHRDMFYSRLERPWSR